MLLVYGILIVAIAGGTASTYLYDRAASLLVRVAAGACSGLAALALIGFLIALPLGLTSTSVIIAGVCAGAPTLIFTFRDSRERFARDLADGAIACRHGISRARSRAFACLVLIAGGFTALWRVMDGAMVVSPEGISTLDAHNLGDLPFHLSTITRFAAGQNLPPEHPSFAGLAFTYPFLADFLSAMLVTAGATLRGAVVLPALLGAFAFVILMRQWTVDLTEDRLAAWIAPVLVLLGGGLGWWMFVRDAIEQGGDLWAFVEQLPRDYTIRDEVWRWGNAIATLLVPQRGLQLALPLALIVFRQWWLAMRDGQGARMWAAGVIAGLLPLMHVHSYVVVMASAVCLTMLTAPPSAWARFFSPAIGIGAPQLLWLSSGGGVDASSLIGWALGWDRGQQNVIAFWLLNTGLFIPLIVCATLWRHARRQLVSARLLRFYLPFALCFAVANVVRLAPWVWDNIKVLVYWWIGSAPLVALLLAHWVRLKGMWRAIACGALASLTLAGTLDVWRMLSGAATVQLLDGGAVEFAGIVTSATEPGATVLHAPTYSHPTVLTGRRSLMGYPGHLWSHGIDYTSREDEIRRLYAGTADARALLDRYAIDYVVVGPDERRFGSVNDAFFSQYHVAGATRDYRLYRIRGQQK